MPVKKLVEQALEFYDVQPRRRKNRHPIDTIWHLAAGSASDDLYDEHGLPMRLRSTCPSDVATYKELGRQGIGETTPEAVASFLADLESCAPVLRGLPSPPCPAAEPLQEDRPRPHTGLAMGTSQRPQSRNSTRCTSHAQARSYVNHAERKNGRAVRTII